MELTMKPVPTARRNQLGMTRRLPAGRRAGAMKVRGAGASLVRVVPDGVRTLFTLRISC